MSKKRMALLAIIGILFECLSNNINLNNVILSAIIYICINGIEVIYEKILTD